jgi:hypothetical protein
LFISTSLGRIETVDEQHGKAPTHGVLAHVEHVEASVSLQLHDADHLPPSSATSVHRSLERSCHYSIGSGTFLAHAAICSPE